MSIIGKQIKKGFPIRFLYSPLPPLFHDCKGRCGVLESVAENKILSDRGLVWNWNHFHHECAALQVIVGDKVTK